MHVTAYSSPGNKLSLTFGKVIEYSIRPPDFTYLHDFARIEYKIDAIRPGEPIHGRCITPYLTRHLFAASKNQEQGGRPMFP